MKLSPASLAARIDMCYTCFYAESMSKMIQVRDVPDSVHGTLKSRAAREGMSLSDFIKRELERVAQRPTMLEWLERMQQTKPIQSKRTAAQVIRELREER
jgi:antitoxin FitA